LVIETKQQKVVTTPALMGELGEINLVHILHLLHESNVNGVLQIKKGALYGVMYFDQGEIVDAHVLTYDGEDAIYEIFLWLTGKFAFYVMPVQRPNTIKRPTEDLILTGARYDERWRKLCNMGIHSRTILRAKPSGVIQRMISEEEEGTLHLAQADQEFLQAANGQRTLGEIASQLGLNRRKLITILSFLLTNGFLDVIASKQVASPFKSGDQVFMPELD